MASPTVWIENPYIIGTPIYKPESFFGREELFQFLRDVLSKQAKVILLHGQRRIGKSSVLRQIPNFVRLEKFAFVSFDLQDQTQLPLSRLLYNLAAEIMDRLELPQGRVTLPTLEELENDPYRFSGTFLPQVYEALRGKNLVLLLDEFDVLSNYSGESAVKNFFPFLQSIIHRQEKLFIIPVVGRRLDDMRELMGLFTGAPHREIGLLDEASATQLITKPAEGLLAYSPEAIQAVIQLSAGHPYFTQLICHVLFARARDQQRFTVTPTDTGAVVDMAIESGEAGLVWFRDGLPIPERIFFSAVAEAQERAIKARGTPSSIDQEPCVFESIGEMVWKLLDEEGVAPTESLRRAEQRLIEWGYLKEVEHDELLEGPQIRSYKVTIELVQRWLLKRHPLRRAISALEQLDPEAHRIYEEAAAAQQQGHIFEALKLYEQVLQANPNHFHALFNMAEARLEVEEFSKALVELYLRAYRVDPIRTKAGFVRALLSYGRDLMLQGKFESAQQQLTQALELEPNNALAHRRLEEAEAGIRRALAVQNPFIVGSIVPPDQFVGREQEVQTIFSEIRSRGHVALYGQRRLGKTSLLHYMASPEVWRKYGMDPTQAFVIYVDCPAIVPFSPPGFWQQVLIEFEKQAAKDTELADIVNLARAEQRRTFLNNLGSERLSGSRSLSSLLQAMGQRKRFLVLLVDEFDVALQAHSTYSETDMLTFLRELRNLAARYTEEVLLSSVVVTRRKLNELGPKLSADSSPWFNHYLFLPLKLFNENEYQALLAKMPAVFAPDSTELAWVRQVAGGHPYLCQAALYILFRLHAAAEPFEIKRATQELTTMVESCFSLLWQDASNLEQMLLMLIALRNLEGRIGEHLYDVSEHAHLIFTQHERELRDLMERGILVYSDRGDRQRYVLFSSLMEWWILKEVEAWREEELDKQAQVFFGHLGRHRAEQLRQLLQQIWQRKLAFNAIEAWAQPLQER